MSIINVHQLISAASQTNLLSMLQSVQTVPAIYTVLQRFTAFRRKCQIDAGLVDGNRVERCQNTNIMDIRFGRIPVRVSKQEK